MIPPANTGKDNNNKNAVINTAHTNNGNLCISNFGDLILIIVVMKLIAPNKELTPAKCNEKIAKSTLPPECASIPDNGGYTVHPVPAPFSTSADATNNVKEGGNSQKLMLFNLGKAMSGAPTNRGTNQFPNPPINIGITMKKIIRKACAVTNTLYR